MPSRKEYLTSIYRRYQQSSKQEKQRMLDEFCATTGYHRKYALRLLNAPLETTPRSRPGRGHTYTSEDRSYLKKLWVILDYPCGQRLQPMVEEMIKVLGRHGELRVPAHVREHLCAMSWKTMDRMLALFRNEVVRRFHGTTKPGSLLKNQIPISLSCWDEKRPGYTELDLVAHCGMSASGEFISTLNITDLASGWTEQEAIVGRAQKRVIAALDRIKDMLPGGLRGIDPDNDSAFINWQLFTYCLTRKIAFTRSRSNRKNDNAHIEQKNWTHVRKIVGYERLETEAEARVLNALYRGPLRLYLNFFQPVMKLMKKERVGGTLKRTYDTPKTPYQRVLESPDIPQEKKQELRNLSETLNPVALKREIDHYLDRLGKLVRARKQQHATVTFHMTERSRVKLHFQMT